MASLLERRLRHRPQPIIPGISGIPGSSTDRQPFSPPPPPEAEEEEEGSEEEWEEDWQQHAWPSEPEISIVTRRKDRPHPLPPYGTIGINANKLFVNFHRGNLAHCGLHASVWSLMLQHKKLPVILRSVCNSSVA